MSPRSSTTPTTDQPSSGSRSTSRISVADHLEPYCTWTAIRGGAAVADEYRHYWFGAAKRPLGPINVGRPGQGLENGLGVCLQQRRLGRYRGTDPKRRPSFPLDALVVCRVVRPVCGGECQRGAAVIHVRDEAVPCDRPRHQDGPLVTGTGADRIGVGTVQCRVRRTLTLKGRGAARRWCTTTTRRRGRPAGVVKTGAG
jgi:hypothetical protein